MVSESVPDPPRPPEPPVTYEKLDLLPSKMLEADLDARHMSIYQYPLGYVHSKIGGQEVPLLVDTACTFATMDISIYLKLDPRPEMKAFPKPVLMANTAPLPIHGYCIVKLEVEDIGPFDFEFLVAGIGDGEAIFGHNLMKLLGAVMDMGRDTVTIAGKTYPYVPCRGRKILSLRCSKATTIPARETKYVTATIQGEWTEGEAGYMTPSVQLVPGYSERGLIVNPGVVTNSSGQVMVGVINLTTTPRRIPEDYEMGTLEEVSEIIPFEKQVMNAEPAPEQVARVMSAVSRGKIPESQLADQPDDLRKEPPISPPPISPLMDQTIPVSREDKLAELMQLLESRKDGHLPEHITPMMESLPAELTLIQRQQVKALLTEYQDVFTGPDGKFGHTDLVQHRIDTGSQAPIKQPPRRTPMATRVIMDGQVKEMLDAGVIEPSSSAWASPVVLVKKKDGSHRFCVDYRRVNDITKKDAYPLPRLDDSVEAMGGAQWFSTLDLHSGYWQVEMDPQDKDKTAFTTRMGLYQFRVMPFGLTNAPATFERLMELVLTGMQWEQLQVYLDDVIVFGKTFLIALYNLTMVFERFRKANLKMKVKKCRLFQPEVAFLGHIVSREGVKCDPAKIEVVANWPHPQSVTEVRSFLGFCTYYRRFIPHFSTVASAMTNLTRKSVAFEWTDECQLAFMRLKSSLMEAPVLAYPREKGQFILDTDASNTGIGGVLSQMQDGEEKVIAYGSKTLSKSERGYCTTYKELLAVIKFLKLFKTYLWGQPILVRTDHASLVWLKNFKEPEGMVARWLATLTSYDVTIQHRPGRRHVNADVLSRKTPNRPCVRPNCPCCKDLKELKEQQKQEKATKARERSDDTDRKAVGRPKKVQVCDGATQTEIRPLMEESAGILDNLTGEEESNSETEEKCLDPPDAKLKLAKGPRKVYPADYRNRRRRRQKPKTTPPTVKRVKQSEPLQSAEKIEQSTPVKTPVMNDISPARICMLRNTPARQAEKVLERIDTWAQHYGKPEWKEYQQQDRDIVAISQMLKDHTDRPIWNTIAGRSIDLRAYWSLWDRLRIHDDVLYRYDEEQIGDQPRCNRRLVVPTKMRTELMTMIHGHKTGGHFGVRKTYQRMKQQFYWPGCKGDIERWCKACNECALSKPGGEKRRAPLVQTSVGLPMDRLGADIVGPLQRTESDNLYILVIVDYFSKWVEAYPLPDKTTHSVADKLVDVVSRFGVPKQLHTDQGGEFTSKVIQEMCDMLGIDKTRTTPYHPSSDGLVERTNRTVQNVLKTCVNLDRNNWDDMLPFVLMAYRATEQESTGCTPNLVMLGREVCTPADVQFVPEDEEVDHMCVTAYVQWMKVAMGEAYELCRTNLGKAAKKQKKYYDQKAVKRTFHTGDWVYRQDPMGAHVKLGKSWRGPYLILDQTGPVTYDLQLGEDGQHRVVHSNDMKRCYGDHPDWIPVYQSGQPILGGQDRVTEPRAPQREELENPVIDEGMNLDLIFEQEEIGDGDIHEQAADLPVDDVVHASIDDSTTGEAPNTLTPMTTRSGRKVVRPVRLIEEV